jgi:riboflavin biosynthesis pyrimidine reductase
VSATAFAEFAARKVREASAAILPAYTTERESRPPDAIAVGNVWSRALFDGDFLMSPAPPGDRPACNLVFVQSQDGNTGARNPSTLGGGETDKHLIYEGLSRVAVDAVLAGAETIRGGNLVFSVWHPQMVALRAQLGLPRHPTQIIATLRGLDIEHALMFNVPDMPIVLLTVGDCARLMRERLNDRPWISSIVMDRPDQLPQAFAELRGKGIARISCIGGRSLATQLVDLALVQDIYLTTSPQAGGERNTPMYPRPLPGQSVVIKRGTGVETGVRFQHLAISGQVGQAGG